MAIVEMVLIGSLIGSLLFGMYGPPVTRRWVMLLIAGSMLFTIAGGVFAYLTDGVNAVWWVLGGLAYQALIGGMILWGYVSLWERR